MTVMVRMQTTVMIMLMKHKVSTWTVAVTDEYQVKEKSERPSKSRYATKRFSRHMSVFKRRRHLSIGGLHLKPVSSTCLRTFRTKAVVWRYFQILSFIRILGAELSKIWRRHIQDVSTAAQWTLLYEGRALGQALVACPTRWYLCCLLALRVDLHSPQCFKTAPFYTW